MLMECHRLGARRPWPCILGHVIRPPSISVFLGVAGLMTPVSLPPCVNGTEKAEVLQGLQGQDLLKPYGLFPQ